MALINCPECNEQISSTVSQCVHCGVKICVCPECEKVYTQTPEQCEECGYVFKKVEEKIVIQKSDLGNTIPDIKLKCKAENPLIFILEHLGTVFNVIVWIIMFFIAIKGYAFVDSLSNIEELLNIENNYESLRTLIVFFAIFDIIALVYSDIKHTLIGHMISLWAKNRKIILTDAIKVTFSTKYKNTVEKEKKALSKDIRQAIHAEFLNENYAAKNKRIVNHAVDALCTIISTVLLGSFLYQNLEIIKTAELLKSDMLNIPGWSTSLVVGWWKIVVSIALALFGFIYTRRVIGKLEIQRSEWVNTVMPEHYEDYRQIAIDVEY